MGGEGVGLHRRRRTDTGVRDGVFCVGFVDLCGECGDFWGGHVGACGFGVGGFCIGVCEFSLRLLFNLPPVLESLRAIMANETMKSAPS